MESISQRELPRRHLKEQVSVLRTVVRVSIWAVLLLATFAFLAWEVMKV